MAVKLICYILFLFFLDFQKLKVENTLGYHYIFFCQIYFPRIKMTKIFHYRGKYTFILLDLTNLHLVFRVRGGVLRVKFKIFKKLKNIK